MPSLANLSQAIEAREVSPVQLTQRAIDRVEELDGRISAFVRVDAQGALEAAKRAERQLKSGCRLGPLHGIPVGVKDLFDTRDTETNAGSRVLAGRVPAQDARLVAQLREAGAIIIGKTTTHEFGLGVTTPPTRNPWNRGRVPGGSSGGSAAAVAAGMVALAIGSDTGGSIRIPSSLCGVAGLKPTHGLLSTEGAIPLSWSLDHAGPITLTASDLALALSVLAREQRDENSLARVEGLVIGVPTSYFYDDLQPDVETALRDAIGELQRLGAVIRTIALPHADAALPAMFEICLSELGAHHRAYYHERADLYGDDVRGYIEMGFTRPGAAYVTAQRVREWLRRLWLDATEGLDAVVTPVVPATAIPVGADVVDLPGGRISAAIAYQRFTAPFSLTGLPALSVLCGFDQLGLPIGMQLVGRPGQEGTLLGVGMAYEAETRWSERTPQYD